MNTHFYIKTLIFALIITLGGILEGCNDAKYSVLGVHGYLKEAQGSLGHKVTVMATGTTSTSLTVCISDRVQETCMFKLIPDQSALDRYNEMNGTSFIMLPEDHYTLPETITIDKGEYEAKNVNISITPFSEEMNSSGESYAIPLRLENIDGNIPTMGQTSTYVIATGSIIKFSAPLLGGTNSTISVDMTPGPITMNEYTIEMRFQLSGFVNRNMAMFSADNAFVRFEDPQTTHDLIQIVGKNSVYLNAITPFEANKWQHLAITYDGSKHHIYVNGKHDAEKAISTGVEEFTTISFIATSQFSKAKCLMSEVRIWDKALSENQLKNNMVVVSPKADGLRAYWKMNEGSGRIFEDATGNGYTATIGKDIEWIHDILSTDVSTPWE
ncbi:DUF1735 and LamG domain-containing protein [Bacteroides caccae]|uniref:DUF1735 and LamG domain-containing protein n=1 Tax=Bacteroides caccae TaxID=47678 RepID=UPI00290C7FBA|nr:DUF1735 and LamG domain-containing protein [Bacteroides caccae]MDU3629282.1 DUF1735 and LamG domain-containing protein [Bacteroides caccae]MDU3671817.1 DUF1735 and LamG domain-containing protein [Bacteroides caccae]